MSRMLKVFGFMSILLSAFAVSADTAKSIKLIRGEPVMSSPYLGERSEFESFDLIVNIPNMEQSLRLLQQMKKAEDRMAKKGYKFPTEPLLDLSGRVEVFGDSGDSFSSDKTNTKFKLSTAELDLFARVNNWSMAFFNMKYDSDPYPVPEGARGVSKKALDNSRFYLDQGFLTIGNFNKCPVYLTAGQLYVPFGKGSTGLIDGFMNGDFYSIKQRAVMIGMEKGCDKLSVHTAVYGFDSALKSNQQDGGAIIDIKFSNSGISGKVSGGVISNILEASLYQSSTDRFAGFAKLDEKDKQTKRVVGWTASASLSYGMFSLGGEVVTACKELDTKYFMQNDAAIKPSAVNIEGTLTFKVRQIPTMFTVGYGRTKQALAFDKPEHRVSMAVIMEPLKSTLLGFELVHNVDYGKTTSSRAWGYMDQNAEMPKLLDGEKATGKTSNTFNIFLGYYF